jgi:uncharacterized protein YbjT (DUF2867 family)
VESGGPSIRIGPLPSPRWMHLRRHEMADHAPVLVIGGTRGTGLIIVQLLHGRGIPARVLARDPVRARRQIDPAVEIMAGDITKPDTLSPAIDGASHIILTAGMRSGRPARESRVRATEYEGVVHTLAAARRLGFSGRFVYLTSSGGTRRSFATIVLNLYKGNTLRWRARAEEDIRTSGLDYTIVRAGVLVNRPAGRRAIVVTQEPLPLSFGRRIARADVAEAFIAAMDHARASKTTFDVIWGKGPRRETWPALLDSLEPRP